MAKKVSCSFALDLWLVLFISLLCADNISALTEPMVHSMLQRNIKFVNMQKTSNGTVSNECNQTLATVMSNTKQLLMYADAAGKPAGGLFLGNGAWLGSYSECKTIPASHYCLASLLFKLPNKTLPQVHWGLCVPKACSENDVLYGLEDIITGFGLDKYVQLSSYAQIPIGIIESSSRAVNCAKPSEYTTGAIATITLCGILLLLCFLGTVIELTLSSMQFASSAVTKSKNFMRVRYGSDARDKEVNATAENGKNSEPYSSTEHTPLIASNASNFQEKQKKNIVVEILLCFSLIRNTNQIMNTKVPPGAITSLNGMRVLSMFWVILGHTFLWSIAASGVTSNLADVLKLQQRFTFQTIQNAEFSVDSFFFLSGLLVSYLSLRQMTKLNGSLPLFKFYFHRFWRLTPSYMFLILFLAKLNGFLGEGPVWFTQQENSLCDKYWWTNLLYINNFYPTSFQHSCMNWSWYLANDMQFYIISPIILYATYRFRWRGFLFTAGVLLLGSFISTASIVGYYKLAVGTMGGGQNAMRDGQINPKKIDQYQSYVYVKPYCRIAPYLVGMALGCLFHYKPKISYGKLTAAVSFGVGWALAITFALASLYGKYGSYKPGGHPFNQAENIIYESFSRFAWGVALAWVIFVCHKGYGGLVDKLLSASYWIPLSRLTYSAYLVHPIILGAYFSSYETAIAYSDVHIVFYFCGILVLSYAAAFIVAVAVEFPMMQLEKVFFKSRERDR